MPRYDEDNIEFAPHHRIYTIDGGFDFLLPGRWIAHAHWLGPGEGHMVHGKTEEEAVENLRAELRRRYPLAQWFSKVPTERKR